MLFNQDEAKPIVESCIGASREFWQIDDNWLIRIRFDRLDPGSPAQIQIDYDYLDATITLDISQCDSSDEIWRFIAHEMCHIVAAPVEILKAKFDYGDPLFTHALERTVVQLERVFSRECKPT